MKRIKLAFPIYFILAVFLGSSCTRTAEKSDKLEGEKLNTQEYLVGSTLYAQASAEYKALCYQAYNLAEMQVNKALADKRERPAVILDLDETVLDNSPYTAWQIMNNRPYTPETWAVWVSEAEAQAIPGAVEFLQMADSLGVELFYVSNRPADGLAATLENLRKLTIPQADSSRVFLKTDSSDKTSRREAIRAMGVDVVLYIGDNLGDYAAIWDEPATNPERIAMVTQRRDEIGVNYIVLPNSLYGTWEGAIYNYDWSLKDTQRDSLRKFILEPWEPKTAL